MPYTTRELAEQCGISPQYVLRYIKNQGLENRLDKSTKSFVIPDDVAIQLITHFAGKETETTEEKKTEKKTETDYYRELVDFLKHELEVQRKQIESKDKIISDLVQNQKELTEQISEYSLQISELITTNKALAGTTALQEYDRVKPDELGQTTEIEADVLENDTQEQAQQKQEKKRGFWARLFGLD